MSSNKNLFYQLYSTSNNTVSAGYTCRSAIDESQTSFNITTNGATGGASAVITDSNGNPLSSIDLSQINASGVTQYNTETRILQPYSCCLLQGQEYGLACGSYYFVMPKAVIETEGYENFITCDFDVIYDNFTPYRLHIKAPADGENSFVELINEELQNNNVEVSVSLQRILDKVDGNIYEYLVFLSQKEGYFYYINNLRISLSFQSEEYPESPFSKELSGMKTIIMDFIEQFHPIKRVLDDEDFIVPEYDESIYEIDCELYTWLLTNYQSAISTLGKFKKALEYLDFAEHAKYEEELIDYLEKANRMLANTPYDDNLFNNYDVENMKLIYDIVESLKAMMEEAQHIFQDLYWLPEDRHMRIPLMKYPNGAYRGIVIIPEWPEKTDEFEYASLWINHVKSQVKLYRPTKEHQFLPKIYGVLANATLMYEENDYREADPQFKGFTCNCACQNNIPDGWDDNLDTNYVDPYRPEHSIYDDLTYMGKNYYSSKKNIIGMFRYMQYVNENKLWNKIGAAYMIVGKDDDPQSQDKNLPTSLIIYNPNPAPIKIKYMIFS